MTNEDELKAQALVDSWYWQMAEGHNLRWKNAVKSMVLFYESAPMEADAAQLVLEYLRTRTGVTSIVIGNKKWTFDAPGWMAKDTWYQTVPGEKWAGTESTKVRAYWVLVQAGDGEADGPYTVENGCKYLVEHTYYWDVASEPVLPASSSGVQYAIQGFTRDRETGLFSYYVEKRTTVQQDVPLYESAKTIFETVSEEQHLGVKQRDLDTTGLAASVGNGERVERHIDKNADCTSNIVNRKVKAEKVEQATTVVRKRLRGTQTATTDRNLTPAEVATKTAAEQEVGETRTIDKTDTDRRNLTVETTTPPTMPLTIAESCENETSVHTHTKVELVEPPAQDGTVEQTAEPNKRKTVSIKKNDDDKTADKTTVTQTWEEKTGGGSSNSGNGAVTTTTVRKENTTSTPSAVPGVNRVVEVEEVPNDHGSKTTVEKVTEFAQLVGGGASSSGGAVNSQTVRRVNSPVPVAAAQASPNVVREVDSQPNDHGSFTVVERTTQFNEVVAVARSKSATEIIVTTTKHNTQGNAEASNGQASAQPNDHGTKSTQVSEGTPIFVDSGWITWPSTNKTPRGIYRYQNGMRVFVNATTPHIAVSGTRGADVKLNFHINKYGLYDGSATYSQLIEFKENTETKLEGGIQTGSIHFGGKTYPSKSFYGRGNEGSEAYYAANCHIVAGVHLPHRTYITGPGV